MMKKCVIFVALLFVAIGESKEMKQLNIAQGPVRGYKESGENVFVFYGVPYTTVPTEPNEYEVPLPPPTWTEPFEAVNKNIICPQMENLFMANPNSTETEDCLIANIYVPDTYTNNLPVLVYVHGGVYQIGYGNFVVAKNLIGVKKMVVVNFNYRLGPHGFLCLGTPDVPGNAGMKDQVALLRWVKKNIASFGGNPNDVTITGYSAGSSSEDLCSVMLSPMTKGNDDNVYVLEEFYKTIPKEVLHSVDVCVERDVGEEIFLDDSPFNILKNSRQHKLPMLYGFAEMEGLIRMPYFVTRKDSMNSKFSDFFRVIYVLKVNRKKKKWLRKLRNSILVIGEETILRYIDYFTDVIYVYPTLRSVRLQVESGNTNIYLYQYDFVDDSTPLMTYTEIRGANHCVQTYGIVDGEWLNLTEDKISKTTKKMKQIMSKLSATFITLGKSVPENSDFPQWPPTIANGGSHMCIEKSLKLRGPLLQQRDLFWDDIYDKHYDFPEAPPTSTFRQQEEL